uniref:Uncharacterized protein n=1 Tax=Anguilla anguilla TaxID=7936 RepID=A0A0E9UPB2_ANGAN
MLHCLKGLKHSVLQYVIIHFPLWGSFAHVNV